MKKYGLKGKADNVEATKKAFEEMMNQAGVEDVNVDVYFYNPEEQIIINKNVPYVLIILGILAGYFSCKIASYFV